MSTLRWLGPAIVPALLLLLVVYWSDKNREPVRFVLGTFALGAVGACVSFFLEYRAITWTGLELRTSVAGDRGALIFLFAIVAPVREASKVAACWPAFRSSHFDEPYDGVVYSSAAALGFSMIENALMLQFSPTGAVAVVRALVALPAHVFFASAWGYALGRAKQARRPSSIFPVAWFLAMAAHGLYIHLVYGRGHGAIVGALPLLAAMGIIAVVAARDLRKRTMLDDLSSSRTSRTSLPNRGPSLAQVAKLLGRSGEPIRFRWVIFGVFVTLGAMIAGLVGGVALGHWARVDFSLVDESDVATTAPVALLGAGLLGAFPMSGYLIAKASSVTTILEPALATGLAITVTLVFLGLAAPVALVFGIAFAPIAWALACAGAWVGRNV